mmetsp:Transcript_20765/g.30859  ORF Transcript_20765/g.30859 Transcript_20765/m.30859 type:complete len:238 (-) Transcript_20765:164-877(-)
MLQITSKVYLNRWTKMSMLYESLYRHFQISCHIPAMIVNQLMQMKAKHQKHTINQRILRRNMVGSAKHMIMEEGKQVVKLHQTDTMTIRLGATKTNTTAMHITKTTDQIHNTDILEGTMADHIHLITTTTKREAIPSRRGIRSRRGKNIGEIQVTKIQWMTKRMMVAIWRQMIRLVTAPSLLQNMDERAREVMGGAVGSEVVEGGAVDATIIVDTTGLVGGMRVMAGEGLDDEEQVL